MTGPARVRWTDLWALLLIPLTAALAWQQIIVLQHPFSLDDWLISYADDPVRRGLSGSLLLGLAGATGTGPAQLVFVLVLGLSALLIVAVARLARPAAANPAIWPLLLSPATFLFPGFDPDGAFRKELLVFVLLALCLAQARKGQVGRAVKAYALSAPLITLMHEGMAPFLLYGIALLGFGPVSRADRRWIAPSVVATGAAVAFAYLFPGGAQDVAAICTALAEWPTLLRAQHCPGISAIGWLARDGSSVLQGPDGARMLSWTLQAVGATAIGMFPATLAIRRHGAARWLGLAALGSLSSPRSLCSCWPKTGADSSTSTRCA